MWIIAFVSFNLLFLQTVATFILLSNLVDKIGRRCRIIATVPHLGLIGKVSIVIFGGNSENICRLLAGVSRQSYEVREIFVLATCDCLENEDIRVLSKNDPRIKFLNLKDGMLNSGSEWVLVVKGGDYIHKNLASSVLTFALKQNCEVVYVLPQFILQSGWLNLPLVLWLSGWYRLGGGVADYCVFLKKELLQSLAKNDIIPGRGNNKAVVADGSDLVKINISKGGLGGMGYCQYSFFILVHSLPLPLLLVLMGLWWYHHYNFLTFRLLFCLNVFLVILRVVIQTAVISTIQLKGKKTKTWFFLYPLADILAVIRWLLPFDFNNPKTRVS